MDKVIKENVNSLKSILKDIEKDLKEQQKVASVPEAKTESMHDFLEWADGKDKNKVTQKAVKNLYYLMSDIKKGLNKED